MNIDKTLDDRGNTHGDFRHNASISQTIKFALEGGPQWEWMADYQKEALHMIAHKMSRIVAGNPHHLDHWHDIAGYAKLAEDRTAADAKEDKPDSYQFPVGFMHVDAQRETPVPLPQDE